MSNKAVAGSRQFRLQNRKNRERSPDFLAHITKAENLGIQEDAGDGEGNGIRAEEKNKLTIPTESLKTCGANATTGKEEDIEGRDSRHVPGGTWLYQFSPF
ncbi:hypothetical protein NDU88_006469 [Pleurodeles waltl]|uniref:Uncharacterized protein n=1 Tax=Pleurodeles waltl TaxID=8319 RepID=A0AAV7WCP0_PLEWA|nr:hypothetical protein NDU88_006469 [Pleurodeles waltl]